MKFDPRQQFSKWLAKSAAWFWYIYMVILAVVIVLEPSVAPSVVYIVITISVVMIFHVWAYTKNSTYEKGLRAMLERVKIERNEEEGSDNG